MKFYQVRSKTFSGKNYSDIYHQAILIFDKIRKKTKRRPYLRSKYFQKEKIFLGIFWQHIKQKREKDRMRRLRFYACALELLEEGIYEPEIFFNAEEKNIRFYRFYGITSSNEKFIVQIKEHLKKNQKYLLSIFPKK